MPPLRPFLLLAKELDNATASDSELCKVCMDAIADCVFLDCGHMVSVLRLRWDVHSETSVDALQSE